MAKSALYWTLVRSFHSHRPMAVTSERGPQVYGRDHEGNPTHHLRRDVVGRFETREAAVAASDGVRQVHEHYEALRKPLQNECSRLFSEERQRIEEFLLGRK